MTQTKRARTRREQQQRVRAFRRGLFAVRSVLDMLEATGGFTYNLQAPGFVTRGFAVSVNPELSYAVSTVSYLEVCDYITEHTEILFSPGKVFGGWLDTRTGLTYLDVVTIVETEQEAVDLAVEHGELAVYDIAGQREIRTN